MGRNQLAVTTKRRAGNVSTSRLPRFVSPSTSLLLANNVQQPRLTTLQSDNESQRMRGWELQKLRAKMFKADPLCAHCRAAGRTRKWDELDHIVPLREGGTNDESNLQGLCYECHAIKSAAESRRANSANLISQNDPRGGQKFLGMVAQQNAPPLLYTSKSRPFEENVEHIGAGGSEK
jgi:5-methylcytosine-specific restriction protein A